MAKTKVVNKVTLKKPLQTFSGDVLYPGTEITLTGDWETTPYHVRAQVILNSRGERLLVADEDLEYALGAH